MKTAALTGILAALALAFATSGGEAARPDPVVVGDGGCSVCRFFDYAGYGSLSFSAPVNRCTSALGGSQGLACSGWSYWDRRAYGRRAAPGSGLVSGIAAAPASPP